MIEKIVATLIDTLFWVSIWLILIAGTVFGIFLVFGVIALF